MNELNKMMALMSSGLQPKAKIRVLRMLYVAVCEAMVEEGYKIDRTNSIEVASAEMAKFFTTKEGAYAAYKMFQMIASLGAEEEEIREQIEEQEQMSNDFSRN